MLRLKRSTSPFCRYYTNKNYKSLASLTTTSSWSSSSPYHYHISTANHCYRRHYPKHCCRHFTTKSSKTSQQSIQASSFEISSTFLLSCLSSARQRLNVFTHGVSSLWSDCLTCLYIEDAARNKRSAWTIDKQFYVQRLNKKRTLQSVGGVSVVDDDAVIMSHLIANRLRLRFQNFDRFFPVKPGRIPRKQMELQRKTKRALRTTVPTVLGFAIPFVGYVFVALGFAFPRILLSRHFHTENQICVYAGKEYKSRIGGHAIGVVDSFWDGLMICGRRRESMDLLLMEWMGGVLEGKEYDAAGPILRDVTPLLDAFLRGYDDGEDHQSVVDQAKAEQVLPEKLNIHKFERDCLVDLALATDAARLPYPTAMVIAQIAPSWVLKRWIRLTATLVALDDALILEEIGFERKRSDNNNSIAYKYCNDDLEEWCLHLTNEEVLDACLLRGLPCDTSKFSFAEMRHCLANHLFIISKVHSSIGSRWNNSDRVVKLMNEESKTENSTVDLLSGGEDDWSSEAMALEMFTLYLPLIRFHLIKRQNIGSHSYARKKGDLVKND